MLWSLSPLYFIVLHFACPECWLSQQAEVDCALFSEFPLVLGNADSLEVFSLFVFPPQTFAGAAEENHGARGEQFRPAYRAPGIRQNHGGSSSCSFVWAPAEPPWGPGSLCTACLYTENCWWIQNLKHPRVFCGLVLFGNSREVPVPNTCLCNQSHVLIALKGIVWGVGFSLAVCLQGMVRNIVCGYGF